jgi:hypothetical protein
VGDAVKVAAALTTVTVVAAVADPPVPLQLSVKVLLPAVCSVCVTLPALVWVPLQAPLAVQDEALVLDHVKVTGAPAVSVAEEELNVTVGAAAVVVTAAGGVVERGAEETTPTSEPPQALRQKTPSQVSAMTFMCSMRIPLHPNNPRTLLIARSFSVLQ